MLRATVGDSGLDGSLPAVEAPGLSLSARLRQETAAAHRAVEAAAGLPARVVTVADYADCLARFFRLFAPLEAAIGGFAGWAELGIDLAARRRTPALLADLAALGCEPPAPAATSLPGFAAALGALYVLEGSALGGKFLCPAFERQLGPCIAGATGFFGGQGLQTGEMWREFRAALDAYGYKNPAAQPAVIAGAEQIFGQFAIGLA
jgi:heme oxygenase